MLCSVCVFWDRNGILKDYAYFYLKALQEISKKLIVVVNGSIKDESKAKIEYLGADVIIRENKGLDFAAYKTAIELIGYDILTKYDNLLFTNTTCYGPFFSLKDIFGEMKNRNVDFWGITSHGGYLDKTWLFKKVKYHIQSYFLVFNKKVLTSSCFKEFFSKVSTNDISYIKVVSSYETELTAFFEEQGFKSDCYINCSKYFNKELNPSFNLAFDIIKNDKCPFLKRKVIISSPEYSINNGIMDLSSDCIEYIRRSKFYDLNLIYDDVISNYSMSDIQFNFHLNYLIDESPSNLDVKENDNFAVCVFNLNDSSKLFTDNASKIPSFCSVIIISKSKGIISEIDLFNKTNNIKNCSLYWNDDKFHNLSAIFKLCSDVFFKYKYALYFHDNSVGSNSSHRLMDIVNKYSIKSFLNSSNQIENILSKFEDDPYLGLLTNTVPVYSIFQKNLKKTTLSDFYANYVKQMISDLKLNVPFDSHSALAYGCTFCCRTECLKKMIDLDFEDRCIFDPIPLLIYSKEELLIPYFVQSSGHYCGKNVPESYSAIYIDSITYNPQIYQDNLNINKLTKISERLFSYKDSVEKNYKELSFLGLRIVFLTPKKIVKKIGESIICFKKTEDKKKKYCMILGVKFNIR